MPKHWPLWLLGGSILGIVGAVAFLWILARGVINWFYGPDPVATAERETYQAASVRGCLICIDTTAPMVASTPAVICQDCRLVAREVLGFGAPITISGCTELREIVRLRKPVVDTLLAELETEFAWTPAQEEAARKFMAPEYAKTEAELRVAGGRIAGGRRSWDLGAVAQ